MTRPQTLRTHRSIAGFVAAVVATLAGSAAIAIGSDVPPNRFGESHARPRTEGTVRIATFNILNMYDEVDDDALENRWEHPFDRGEQDGLSPSEAEAAIAEARDANRRRYANIADMIRQVDADVLALQEVESLEALEWFRDTWLADLGYDHVVSTDVGYFRGVECSVLSRFPIADAQIWSEESLAGLGPSPLELTSLPEGEDADALTFRRRPLRVDVEMPGGDPLTFVVLHHKSGRSYAWQREREALRIVENVQALRKAEPDRAVVVLGDFNAAPWDVSVRLYVEAGLADVQADRISPRRRWSEQSPAEQAWSPRFKTHRSGRVIDYIFCDPNAAARIVPGTAHVVGAPFDPEFNWREDPYPPFYGSDHYPVIVDLRYPAP